MASVELQNVTKIYDNKVKAVKEANLIIEDKEFVVLVGPSGCGKSTLLRMIAGLEEISDGTILIDGKVVNEVPPKDRDIAMVFQNYALYPHMTVYENMAFGLKLRKFPKSEIKQRVGEAAQILDIQDYLDRKPKALSGGQRQRVAVGRAIVRHPKVFLFDEPLSNLDAKLRVQMRIEINRLHHQLQTTMIYVTHDQVEAMTMGTKIVVLKDGLIQQVDSPLSLYKNPVNRFVAGFIGSPAMNFFEGQLESQSTGLTFKSDVIDFQIPISSAKALQKYIGSEIVFGVRPEDILDQSMVDDELVKCNKAIVIDIVEPIGNEIFIYFRDSANISHCLRIPPDRNYKIGDKIAIGIKPEKLYFFDNSTDERIV